MSSTGEVRQVTLDEAVELLRSLGPELPKVLDRRWAGLEPQVADLLAALETAQDDAERLAVVEDLVTLLGVYRAVRSKLAPIQELLDRSSDSDRGLVRIDRGGVTRPAMVERTPHMDISGPEPLAVGDRFTVEVYLDTEAFRPGETGSRALLPDLPVLQLHVWLTTSDHFRVIGQETAVITVRSGKDRSSTATFELEHLGTGDGERGITALFSYNGRGTGSVRRVLSADTAAAAGSFAVDPNAREADLTVRVSRHPSGDNRRFNVSLSGALLDGYAGETEGEWRLSREPEEVVETYMNAFTTSTPGARKAAFARRRQVAVPRGAQGLPRRVLGARLRRAVQLDLPGD